MHIKISENLKETYSNQYVEESATWRSLGALQKYKNIIAITAGFHFEKVLEVGAGEGSILKLLSENGFAKELNAIEISESGIEQIKLKNIELLKSVQLFDGYKIPFADKSMDLIVLSHVLEHVEHERILLRELHRVGKKIVIEVPKDYRFGADKKLNHFLSYGHINIYSPTLLKYLLLTENFNIISSFTRLYSKKTYLFNKHKLNKLKAIFIYTTKKILSNTPFEYINEKFINTITVLIEPQNSKIKIYLP